MYVVKSPTETTQNEILISNLLRKTSRDTLLKLNKILAISVAAAWIQKFEGWQKCGFLESVARYSILQKCDDVRTKLNIKQCYLSTH